MTSKTSSRENTGKVREARRLKERRDMRTVDLHVRLIYAYVCSQIRLAEHEQCAVWRLMVMHVLSKKGYLIF